MKLIRQIIFFVMISLLVGVASGQDTQFVAYYKSLIHENLKAINSKTLIGVELLFAGPSRLRPESAFGHTLLRFVDNDDDPFNDFVLSFVADVTDPQLSIKKGLVGDYKTIAEILTLAEFTQKYVEGEGRYLDRMPLQLEPQQIKDILSALDRIVKKDNRVVIGGYFVNYTFLLDNCASQMLTLFDLAGLPTSHYYVGYPMTPKKNLHATKSRLIAPYAPYRFDTTYELTSSLAKQLKIDLNEVRVGRLPDGAEKYLIGQPLALVVRYYTEVGIRNQNVRKAVLAWIQSELKKQKSIHFGIEAFPPLIYRPCTTKTCAWSQAKLFLRHWGGPKARATLKSLKYNIYYQRLDFIDEQNPSPNELSVKNFTESLDRLMIEM